MKNLTFRVAGILIVFGVCLTLANASQPCLKQLVRTNGQATVLLEGETRVGYVLQASSNLVDWQACLTNAEGYSSKRLLTLDAPESCSYYRAQRIPAPLFLFAIVSKGQIDMGLPRWLNLTVDSFDSSDPLYSSNGLYTITKRKDQGDVVAGLGLTNSGFFSPKIYGHLVTSSNAGVDIGVHGSVGNLTWFMLQKDGIKPGYYTNDFVMDFPEFEDTFTGGYLVPAAGTNAGIFYDYILDGGQSGGSDYALDTLDGGGSIFVTSNTVLHVLGGGPYTPSTNIFYIPFTSITIASNSSLTLYMNALIANLGPVICESQNATNFSYIGTRDNYCLNLQATNFTGSIYAPSAALTLTETRIGTITSADTLQFTGACVVKKLVANLNVSFHYDEALQRTGFVR